MRRVLVGGAEVGVGVEVEAVEAECAESAPGFAVPVVNRLGVSHGAH